ncbi:MAG: hypothetical protein CUN55_17040 [Phototrophicales bacterium]|nr:MAG: hypothetical protein CUN55_17040 [Phototrophicales bacterium]
MNPISALFVILLVLLILFFALNTDPVSVDFLLTEQQVSLALVIIISTLIGFVLGIILPRLLRREVEHVALEKNKAKHTEDAQEAQIDS